MILLLILVFVVGVGGFLLDRSMPRVDALSSYEGRIGDTPGTNFLIVGSDSRIGLTPEQEAEFTTGGDTGTDRTDTILLVHKPRGGDTVLVSIPRDSYVPIPGYGYEKINAAFAFGGAPLLVQTIEESTGVHIDHYLEVGFAGFAGITDAVGGVEMCLENPMTDPLAGIDLAPGCQTLSGRESLGFVRSRATPLADLDRMNNQREFMSALSDKIASPTTILNPFRSIPLARAVGRAIAMDERDTLIDAVRLGLALRGTIVTTTVPVGGFGDLAGIGNVLYWDANDAPRFWGAISRGEPLPGDLITSG
ncbi:LCP family protein [Hoyosella altamirensis]|uniref:LCP family protein required for cell wall assembly n=1 Tax=Hoyosella altamirensis TaxID=616997 RepID=A0A839RP79_9ACTN|nr:LCP family protein required for cell wall assembly [Hoyosella altamirensis]